MVELQQTGIVAQLIGMCEEPAWPEVVLQYHSLGSLLTVSQLPDVLSLRWRIIMSYLDVVEKLHNRVPRSPRVLCDASRTEITLSQVTFSILFDQIEMVYEMLMIKLFYQNIIWSVSFGPYYLDLSISSRSNTQGPGLNQKSKGRPTIAITRIVPIHKF